MHRGWIANNAAEDTYENHVCVKSGVLPRNLEVCMPMKLLLIPNCWSVIVGVLLSYSNNYSRSHIFKYLVFKLALMEPTVVKEKNA